MTEDFSLENYTCLGSPLSDVMARESVTWRREKGASAASRTATVNECECILPFNPPSRSGIEFFFMENENGMSSAVSRKQARAYVAKQAHARVRRERMAHHQESTSGHPERAASGDRYKELQSKDESPYRLKDVLLPPVSPRTLLSAAPIDPFASAARYMSPFEHSLLLHYIERVVPIVQATTFAVTSPEEYLHGINRDWIPLALTDPGLLDGILISACRSLHALCSGESPYLKAALRYKVTCIRSLNNDISKDSAAPRDSTIAKAIMLAGDEVAIGDFKSGKHHIDAALHMVTLRGGASMLGTNQFLRTLIDYFSSEEMARVESEMVFMGYRHFRT